MLFKHFFPVSVPATGRTCPQWGGERVKRGSHIFGVQQTSVKASCLLYSMWCARQINTFHCLTWQSKPCLSHHFAFVSSQYRQEPSSSQQVKTFSTPEREDTTRLKTGPKPRLMLTVPAHQTSALIPGKHSHRKQTSSFPRAFLIAGRKLLDRTWLWHFPFCCWSSAFSQSLLIELIPFGWGHSETACACFLGKDLGEWISSPGFQTYRENSPESWQGKRPFVLRLQPSVWYSIICNDFVIETDLYMNTDTYVYLMYIWLLMVTLITIKIKMIIQIPCNMCDFKSLFS